MSKIQSDTEHLILNADGSGKEVRFQNNGTQNVVIDSSGNVGIGTASPATALEVKGVGFINDTGSTTGRFVIRNSTTGSSAGGLDIRQNGVDADINNASNGVMTFKTNNTERMRINSNGNVGIGTTAGTTTVSSGLAINNATASNYPGLEIQTAGVTRMYFNANNSASYITSVSTNPLVFYTDGGERMRIDSSGRVGIGLTNPSTKLHVLGSSIIANATTIDPDSYNSTVVAGTIADGGGWAAHGIGGNNGTGDSWALAHNGTNLYLGMGDGSNTDSMATILRFENDGTNRITYSYGDIVMASGKGIDFSASEGTGASSSVLDDYEEGTWTPSFNNGWTTSSTNGQYTKIGNQVYVTAYLSGFTSTGSDSTDPAKVVGLPFTAAAGRAAGTMFGIYFISGNEDKNVVYLDNSGIYFYGVSSGGFIRILNSGISSNTTMYIQATYRV